MKLITLQQPWASLVALGLKQFETRHWATTYSGPLLIHAAKRPIRKGDLAIMRSEVQRDPVAQQVLNAALEAIERSPNYGLVVAIAHLSECILMDQTNLSSVPQIEKAVGVWASGRYAFRLEGVKAIAQPPAFKSRQGKLLSVPDELLADLQLAGVKL